MARRLILDTSVLVAAERHQLDLRAMVGDDDPAIASITATEILVGVERAKPGVREPRALHAEAMLAVLPLEPYTLVVARQHAQLLRHSQHSGRPRGWIDLVIAATASATGRILVSVAGAADFADLPGVNAELVRL